MRRLVGRGRLDRVVCPVACSFMLHMSRSRLASPTPIWPQNDSLINCWVPQHLRALANKPSAVSTCSQTQSNVYPKGLFSLYGSAYLREYWHCSCHYLYRKFLTKSIIDFMLITDLSAYWFFFTQIQTFLHTRKTPLKPWVGQNTEQYNTFCVISKTSFQVCVYIHLGKRKNVDW